MRQSVYKKTLIQVGDYSAEVNIKFRTWDRVGGKTSYSIGVAETAKALKAIAKAAGFNVLGCKSHIYSGGNSVDIYVETELTPEQTKKNEEIIAQYGSRMHPEYTHEPREKLLNQLCKHFQQGNFDGMTDMYEYKKGGSSIKDPAGDDVALDTKYCFDHFITKEEHARWHK